MTSPLHRAARSAAVLAALATTAVLAPVAPATAAPTTLAGLGADHPHRHTDPIVIAHRGASGYRPEHTLAAYQLAIEQGADFIEPDLVSTKDGVLVARHENEISTTTDVEDHPEFADRKTTKTIDGHEVTGWFTEDFTLAELKTLRAEERLPAVRPDNTQYDGLYEIPTFEEVLQLVQDVEEETGREIGIAPETKHPSYFDSIGLSMEEPLVALLDEYGMDKRSSEVVLQSFEIGNLQDLDQMTDVDIAQLVDASGAPYDRADETTYAEMVTRAGLRRISRYADWVAPNKNWILPRDPATGATGAASAVVRDAHRSGLKVVTWTLRAENQFMATNFRVGSDPNAYGDMAAEVTAFLDAGVDALFSDHPDIAVEARDAWED